MCHTLRSLSQVNYMFTYQMQVLTFAHAFFIAPLLLHPVSTIINYLMQKGHDYGESVHANINACTWYKRAFRLQIVYLRVLIELLCIKIHIQNCRNRALLTFSFLSKVICLSISMYILIIKHFDFNLELLEYIYV